MKYAIDCPLCSVFMKQLRPLEADSVYIAFKCDFCDTLTQIPKSNAMTKKAVYRREQLEKHKA